MFAPPLPPPPPSKLKLSSPPQANKDALTALVEALRKGFDTAGARPDVNKTFQLSFDTGIYPLNQQSGYDHAAMAPYLDFLLPMGYDMCWGTQTGESNDPVRSLQAGVDQYTSKLNIAAGKVVLGLPWYGWDFPCSGQELGAPCDVTPPAGKPWYGYATQVPFDNAIAFVQNGNNATPVIIDPKGSGSKYFDRVDASGKRHQVWFDDAETLRHRYAMVKEMGLGGVAFWTANFVNYTQPDGEAAAMWDALRVLV